jgi:hypothetical protein
MSRANKLKDIKSNQYHKKFRCVGFEDEYKILFSCFYGTPVIRVIDQKEDKGFELVLGELVVLLNEAKKFFRDPTKGTKY